MGTHIEITCIQRGNLSRVIIMVRHQGLTLVVKLVSNSTALQQFRMVNCICMITIHQFAFVESI